MITISLVLVIYPAIWVLYTFLISYIDKKMDFPKLSEKLIKEGWTSTYTFIAIPPKEKK